MFEATKTDLKSLDDIFTILSAKTTLTADQNRETMIYLGLIHTIHQQAHKASHWNIGAYIETLTQINHLIDTPNNAHALDAYRDFTQKQASSLATTDLLFKCAAGLTTTGIVSISCGLVLVPSFPLAAAIAVGCWAIALLLTTLAMTLSFFSSTSPVASLLEQHTTVVEEYYQSLKKEKVEEEIMANDNLPEGVQNSSLLDIPSNNEGFTSIATRAEPAEPDVIDMYYRYLNM